MFSFDLFSYDVCVYIFYFFHIMKVFIIGQYSCISIIQIYLAGGDVNTCGYSIFCILFLFVCLP